MNLLLSISWIPSRASLVYSSGPRDCPFLASPETSSSPPPLFPPPPFPSPPPLVSLVPPAEHIFAGVCSCVCQTSAHHSSWKKKEVIACALIILSGIPNQSLIVAPRKKSFPLPIYTYHYNFEKEYSMSEWARFLHLMTACRAAWLHTNCLSSLLVFRSVLKTSSCLL